MKPASTGAVTGPWCPTTMALTPLNVHAPPATVVSCPPKITVSASFFFATWTHNQSRAVGSAPAAASAWEGQSESRRPSGSWQPVVVVTTCAAEAGAASGRPSKLTRSPGAALAGGSTNFTVVWS